MNVKQKNEIIKLFNVELAMNNTYCFNNTEKITKTYTLQFSIILNLCRPLQSLRYVDCIANCSACNHSSFSLYLSIEITVQYYNVTSLRPKSRSMFFFFFVCALILLTSSKFGAPILDIVILKRVIPWRIAMPIHAFYLLWFVVTFLQVT